MRRKKAGVGSYHLHAPRAVLAAAKVEARRHGRTLRDVVEDLLVAWLRDAPAWRAYLAEHARAPEAWERGKLRTVKGSRNSP